MPIKNSSSIYINEGNTSLLILFNEYAELINNDLFEDVLTVHLMYSHGIDTETIAFLTFDSINEYNYITYFDTRELVCQKA